MKLACSRSILVPLVLVAAMLSIDALQAQTIPTQTLMWAAPNPVLIYQPVTLYAEVIGNGGLAPTAR